MKHAKFLLVSMLALGSTGLWAHTGLEDATPADGAVLNTAPETLALSFGDDVQLLKLDITTAGLAQEMDFKPSAVASKMFSIPLPALAPAVYEVNWTILGADGHRVEGKLGFTVDPAATESAGTAHTEEHHGH